MGVVLVGLFIAGVGRFGGVFVMPACLHGPQTVRRGIGLSFEPLSNVVAGPPTNNLVHLNKNVRSLLFVPVGMFLPQREVGKRVSCTMVLVIACRRGLFGGLGSYDGILVVSLIFSK